MSCVDCFNGCTEIVSDKCVKYTGLDIPALGIENGDNLLVVENKITAKILTLMDGTGIIPKLDPADVCAVVQQFLPCCPPLNLNVVLTAFLKAICDIDSRLGALKDRVIVVEDKLVALNADYIIKCLTGVTPDSDTHEIVQATIDEVCALKASLSLYVPIAQIDEYIAAYLAGLPINNKNYVKMIPYTPLAYYGPLTDFDGTGAGVTGTVWEKVYLCNGTNGTPDLRGRVLVGATTMGGSVAMDPEVEPSPGNNPNPAYAVPTPTTATKVGVNAIKLAIGQIPAHDHNDPITHSATVTINDPGHIHIVAGSSADNGGNGTAFIMTADNNVPNGPKSIGTLPLATPTPTNLKGTGVGQNVFVATLSAGGDGFHANIQPSRAANFIMYIP